MALVFVSAMVRTLPLTTITYEGAKSHQKVVMVQLEVPSLTKRKCANAKAEGLNLIIPVSLQFEIAAGTLVYKLRIPSLTLGAPGAVCQGTANAATAPIGGIWADRRVLSTV